MSEEYEVEAPAAVEELAVVEEAAAVVVEEPEAAPVVEEAPVKTSSRRGGKPAVEVEAIVVEEPAVEPAPAKVVMNMKALVYSPKRKNSESVAVLQKRLSDVGYAAARADLRGWFHDNTRAALTKWQDENGLPPTGECDFDEMRYLFDGTDVEIVA